MNSEGSAEISNLKNDLQVQKEEIAKIYEDLKSV